MVNRSGRKARIIIGQPIHQPDGLWWNVFVFVSCMGRLNSLPRRLWIDCKAILTHSNVVQMTLLKLRNESVSNVEKSYKVHPVFQFVLLIVPVVMTGFFLVYSLTGLILEGKTKLNWSLEAIDVANWVGGGIALYSLSVIAFALYRKLGKYHLLMVSAVGHLVLALILTAIVYIIVKL